VHSDFTTALMERVGRAEGYRESGFGATGCQAWLKITPEPPGWTLGESQREPNDGSAALK